MPPQQGHIRPPTAPIAMPTLTPAPATRVLIQKIPLHPATLPRVPNHKTIPPHLVSPDPMQHMSPKNPPMFIPTPKGVQPVFVNRPQPHVIPQVYAANFAATIKPTIKGKYVTAANILANSVIDETT
eukprot:10138306-Ditylum_brightwellii.AAC.1